MSSNDYKVKYTLQVAAGVKVVLSPQNGANFTITVEGSTSSQTSLTVGSKDSQQSVSQSFTIQGQAYEGAVLTCSYDAQSSFGGQDQSTCEIYFNLGTPSSSWSVTGTPTQGDNTTIISSSDPGTNNTIKVQKPTTKNPPYPVSINDVLDPQMVFLLDKTDDTLIFRGNAPLGEATQTNPTQKIDFDKFQDALSAAYKKQTEDDFPVTSYDLFIVALLGPGDPVLPPEINSFGGTVSDLSEDWYPAAANPAFPITLSNGGELSGRMCQWNLNPAGPTSKDGVNVQMGVTLATKLNNWMYNNPIPSSTSKSDTSGIKRVIYIHCDSGHDRTGMMCVSYLNQKKLLFSKFASGSSFSSTDLSHSYIAGTTLNKITYSGGHYAQNCFLLNSKTTPSSNKSRCFLISSSYDQTAVWIAEQLVKAKNGGTAPTLAIDNDAQSGNVNYTKDAGKSAYVLDYYDWKGYSGSNPPTEE